MQIQSQDFAKKVTKTKIKWGIWAAVLLWMVVIFCFSAQNGTQSAHLSETVQQYIVQIVGAAPQVQDTNDQFVLRKLAHFTVYLVLGGLCMSALLQTPRFTRMRTKAAVALAISTGYAASDELHQLFVGGRAARLLDIGIDAVGAFCGIMLVLLGAERWRKRQKKKEQKQG